MDCGWFLEYLLAMHKSHIAFHESPDLVGLLISYPSL